MDNPAGNLAMVVSVVTVNRAKEVEAVDLFLARPKTLVGKPPVWKESSRRGELEAAWNVADDIGVTVGQLRFRCPRYAPTHPSASLIYQDNPVWRIDLVSPTECKYNPHDAGALGLEPHVCGPHEHAWEHNRSYLLTAPGWALPYRRIIQPNIRRIEQILPVLAEKIGLTLDSDQRYFDGPSNEDLFGRRE